MKHQINTIRKALELGAGAPEALTALSELERMAGEQVQLDHLACIDDGELRYVTGRKAPAYDCELYAMPDGKRAPKLYAAPPAQPQYEAADMATAAAQGFRDGVASVAQQPQAEVGNSGFDHKTAADFLSGKTVSDEAVRKFVQASRWAYDDRASLQSMLLSVRNELASREAEIALLKKELMEAEAAHQRAEAVPEMHDALCPALTGGDCTCTPPATIDKAWAQFCGGIGRGPDAPYPGMIEAFEAHYGQVFTDKDWREETGVWAAAWKAAKAHGEAAPQQAEAVPPEFFGPFTYCGQPARFLSVLKKIGDPYRYAIAWETKHGRMEHVSVVAYPDHDIEFGAAQGEKP